jgi:hypothetical protein
MLHVNSREAIGPAALRTVEALCAGARQFAEPETAIDGRLLPHEWVETAGRCMKLDALDHHRDHFLPGATDAAWDVAGLLVEFSPGAPRQHDVVQRYAAATGDRTIAQRLPFYLAAYAAFRTGYCTFAHESLDGAERERFRLARERYAGILASHLRAPRQVQSHVGPR